MFQPTSEVVHHHQSRSMMSRQDGRSSPMNKASYAHRCRQSGLQPAIALPLAHVKIRPPVPWRILTSAPAFRRILTSAPVSRRILTSATYHQQMNRQTLPCSAVLLQHHFLSRLQELAVLSHHSNSRLQFKHKVPLPEYPHPPVPQAIHPKGHQQGGKFLLKKSNASCIASIWLFHLN